MRIAAAADRKSEYLAASPPPGPPPHAEMAWIPGGVFLMGAEDFYPEERPVHQVSVDGFWMDRFEVTVADFRRFVQATSYVTVAERAMRAGDYPGVDPALLVPGSLVFRKASGPVRLDDYRNWWGWVPGASWMRPEGPGSNLQGRARHPITQVTAEDAEAFATWAGKALPTEAEWEFAARGGLEGATFTWGNEPTQKNRMMANTWQGEFPWENLRTDGFEGTSPVGTFPPNGYGLFDMAGNVWEWTSDFYTARHPDAGEGPCCSPHNPRVESAEQSYDVGQPGQTIPRRVTKGGSHLCAPNYCLRYRPAARQPQMIESSTTHIGFRCIVRVPRA
jgi:formylglycine-generating enzyme required for sulfatase activity